MNVIRFVFFFFRHLCVCVCVCAIYCISNRHSTFSPCSSALNSFAFFVIFHLAVRERSFFAYRAKCFENTIWIISFCKITFESVCHWIGCHIVASITSHRPVLNHLSESYPIQKAFIFVAHHFCIFISSCFVWYLCFVCVCFFLFHLKYTFSFVLLFHRTFLVFTLNVRLLLMCRYQCNHYGWKITRKAMPKTTDIFTIMFYK